MSNDGSGYLIPYLRLLASRRCLHPSSQLMKYFLRLGWGGYLSCSGLSVLLLSGIALSGCALGDRKSEHVTQMTPNTPLENDAEQGEQSVAGYPYPPAELWRRLMRVIKTPPRELTHQKLGEIFSVEFDEEKILWLPGQEPREYSRISKSDIKSSTNFYFSGISLSQFIPPGEAGGKRKVVFWLDLFKITGDPQLLWDQAERYCIKPPHAELEALGYHYDQIRPMPLPDRRGVSVYQTYREEVFVDDLTNRLRADRTLYLRVVGKGCLIGAHFIFNQ